MRYSYASALLPALAVLMCAQETRPEIRGVILEPGIEQPIADVEIELFGLPERSPDKPTIMAFTTKEPLHTAKTDSHGAFRIAPDKLGEYSLRLKKDGYGQSQTILRQMIAGSLGSSTTLMLDKDHPTRDLRFYLARPGEISGQIIDEETGKPLAGINVQAPSVGWQWGFRRTGPGSSGKTDAEGRFTIRNLAPGEYVVNTAGAGTPKAFPAPDPAWEREDYPRTFYPNVRDEDSAMVVSLPSAGVVNLGQLRLKKAPRYHARIKFGSAECEPGQKVSLVVIKLKGPFTNGDGGGNLVCGQESFLGPIEPGEYTLRFSAGDTFNDDSRREGWASIVVTQKDVEVTGAFEKGLVIDGKFVLSEGVPKMPLKGAVIAFGRALTYSPSGRAGDDGTFRIVNIAPGDSRIVVGNVPPGLYVKGIRYNGGRVQDSVTLNGSALAQSVVIELSDKPASITGAVKQGDRAVEKAWVVLQKWPMPLDAPWTRRPTAAGEDGNFQFTGLAPGEYHIFAISPEDRLRLEEPGMWERLASAGQKISLGPAGFENVSLTPADPGR
jgi:hypothetical protein